MIMEADIKNKIYTLLDSVLPAWGVSDFADASLFECAAKRRIPDGARSIVSAIFPYKLDESDYEGLNVSRYAAVPDYHEVAARMLHAAADGLKALLPGESFEVFIDNSPIAEVQAAVMAGLGVRGKNGVLITPVYGSWVFIGELVSTLPHTSLRRENAVRLPDCAGCARCFEACPTGALSEKGVDKALCLSRISQQREPLTPEQEELMRKSGCAWGCDLCQKACPLNDGSSRTPIAEFVEGRRVRAESGDDVRGRAFAWRGAEVIERNLRLLGEAGRDDG